MSALPAELRAAAGRLYGAVEIYTAVQGLLEQAAAHLERIGAQHAAERGAWEQERAELKSRLANLSRELRDEQLRTAVQVERVAACQAKLRSYGVTA